jgi:hypothetical protein
MGQEWRHVYKLEHSDTMVLVLQNLNGGWDATAWVKDTFHRRHRPATDLEALTLSWDNQDG